MQDTQNPGTTLRPKLLFIALLALLLGLSRYITVSEPELFDRPASEPAPAALLPDEIPDFSAIADVDQKKQTFFDFLQPFIDRQNLLVLRQRERLQAMVDKVERGQPLLRRERDFIRELSGEYQLDSDSFRNQDFLNRLLRRVDVLPPSLVLAQAANESAWGTSRFAQQGNNFFGQWCFSEGCGLVPNRRRADARHEVKSFVSVAESVAAYFRNLNTFPSYLEMRLIREELRRRSQPIDGLTLAEGLHSYSERGDEYITELQSMIQFNELQLRDAALTPEYLY